MIRKPSVRSRAAPLKRPLRSMLVVLVLGCSAIQSLSAASVNGEVTEFHTAAGMVEKCTRIADFPGAKYSKHDRKDEQAYCELDFKKLAMCPKLWSTSPGTILFRIDENANLAAWEAANCANGHHAREKALEKPAVYKISVNARDTSATYAPSSWVYYHLSRYFGTQVHVPVAVYRSTDAAMHNKRVTKPALHIIGDNHRLRMLGAGWRFLNAVETGTETGGGAQAALTDNGRQVFGTLLDNKGDRYGAEFNGTRESGWGAGQNNDFQQTAPFIALRDPKPVPEAARDAIHEARKNPRMAKELPADTSVEQIVMWMQDVTEITLMDYILGQQDRIGNIDYIWRWYWVEDGELKSESAQSNQPPAEIAMHQPIRLRQSASNDNDAGVRQGYADFAAKTHMLDGLRHYNPQLYRRLGLLAADFASNGPARKWLTESAGLGEKEASIIVQRTGEAFALLQADCRSGALALDLDPASYLARAALDGQPAKPSCEISAD